MVGEGLGSSAGVGSVQCSAVGDGVDDVARFEAWRSPQKGTRTRSGRREEGGGWD